MNKKKVILAIDTSNYTTSVAIVGIDGALVANLKRLLPVKEGECGLRQSDALFHHTVNIPLLMREASGFLSEREIVAVGVSEKPRNAEGSYMPCFLAGVSAAESISCSLGIPLYRFSHQCGHIMAALYSSNKEELSSREFAAFHVSGGTTELLRVHPAENGFETELVGGTADLNAGQVIDRIGVRLGLSFPAGPALEKLAVLNTEKIPKKKPCVKGLSINLSGLENMADKLYSDTQNKELTAAFVLDFLSRGLDMLSKAYETAYGSMPFVYAGGVMCNSIIRSALSVGREAYFAEPAMSADNAVGVAVLALYAYNGRINGEG